MTKQDKQVKRLMPLVRWTLSPYPMNALPLILNELTDKELVWCFRKLTGPQARIAWAEYGRRKGFVDFVLKVAVMEGKLQVTFEGEAKPLHSGPLLEAGGKN